MAPPLTGRSLIPHPPTEGKRLEVLVKFPHALIYTARPSGFNFFMPRTVGV
jgi:hypothetical protein